MFTGKGGLALFGRSREDMFKKMSTSSEPQ